MKFAHLSSLAIALAAASPALAEEVRQLKPHEHGHGVLNIAIEGTRVSMELDVPGMDIVGFEHAASTPEQKAAVSDAEARLRDAPSLFQLPEAAGCKVSDVKVSLEAEGEHDHEAGHDHDHDHDAKAEHEDEGDHEGHESHNDYNVSYNLACAQPGEITAINFGYFEKFAGARGLTVNVVSEEQQNSFEVTREKPTLTLPQSM